MKLYGGVLFQLFWFKILRGDDIVRRQGGVICGYAHESRNDMKRLLFAVVSIMIFVIEVLIGMYAGGWIRNSLGDILVVILLYTLFRSVFTGIHPNWYVIPTMILVFAFCVEFLQLWGFCARFGITNKLMRIIIGTGFSCGDLVCYIIGSIPCYFAEYRIDRTGREKRGD